MSRSHPTHPARNHTMAGGISRIGAGFLDLGAVVAAEMLDCMARFDLAPPRWAVPDIIWTAELHLRRADHPHSLTPATEGFRRITDNELVIGPDRIRFRPETIPPGRSHFTIEVDVVGLPSTSTIYQAIVVRQGHTEPVCDPVILATPIHPEEGQER